MKAVAIIFLLFINTISSNLKNPDIEVVLKLHNYHQYQYRLTAFINEEYFNEANGCGIPFRLNKSIDNIDPRLKDVLFHIENNIYIVNYDRFSKGHKFAIKQTEDKRLQIYRSNLGAITFSLVAKDLNISLHRLKEILNLIKISFNKYYDKSSGVKERCVSEIKREHNNFSPNLL